MFNGIRWGQSRGLNKDEERYFSEDGPDEDDEPIQLISSPNITSKNINALKRKRMTGSALRSSPRSQQMTLPRTPPIGSLVDYGEDDDDDLGGLSGVEDLTGLGGRRRGVAAGAPTGAGPPATPRLTHRRITSQPFQPLPTPDDEEEDEEDTLLESLVSKSGPSIKLKPTPLKLPSQPFDISPLRAGEKRRRQDDEDDGMLERLATKAKRKITGNGEGVLAGVKLAEEGGGILKKIKLKFGAVGIAAASVPPPTTPVPSETGAKDGDNG